MIRLTMVLGLMVITASFAIWDRFENSTAVRVKVEQVTRRCYAKSENYGFLNKTTRTTDMMDCERLYKLVSLHPDFQGMTVHDQTYVTFHYVSPYDGRRHYGQALRRVNDNGGGIKVNDEITVRVRQHKIGQVQVF